MQSTLDTHELVTRTVRLARDFDVSHLATKADLAELELRLIKWVIGVGIALAVGGMIWTATQILLHPHP
jgi:hypothetical protein